MENSTQDYEQISDCDKLPCHFRYHRGSIDESVRMYAELAVAGSYMKQNHVERYYNGPYVLADAIATLVPENRESVKILDMGAGTGILSRELRKLGFDDLDAIDATQEMLNTAKKDNLYNQYICSFITDEELDIEGGQYDIVTMSSGFAEGHIPCASVREMIRLLKKGGLACFNMREEYLWTVEEYTKLEKLLEELEQEKKCTKVTKVIYPKHYYDFNGALFYFRKL